MQVPGVQSDIQGRPWTRDRQIQGQSPELIPRWAQSLRISCVTPEEGVWLFAKQLHTVALTSGMTTFSAWFSAGSNLASTKLPDVRAGSQKVLICLQRGYSVTGGLAASICSASPSLSVGKLGRGLRRQRKSTGAPFLWRMSRPGRIPQPLRFPNLPAGRQPLHGWRKEGGYLNSHE